MSVTNYMFSGINAQVFRGSIDVANKFPTLASVIPGWTYTCTADVTDNDATKTNTGQSFLTNDEIVWNGTDWTNLGSIHIHGVGSSDHSASSLADLNTKVTDATLGDAATIQGAAEATAAADATGKANAAQAAAEGTAAADATSKANTAQTNAEATAAGALAGHTGDTANPHATDVGNLGSGTISELNTAITDATMLGSVDEDDLTSDSATLVPTQQSVKAYVDTYRPKLYDVVAEDWLSDAAAGGGGVWDFLVDGATSPSGWVYSNSGITPSVCRINADGSYTLTMARVGTNGSATLAKVFTSEISSDPAMWPETKGFWELDATGTTGVGGGQVIGHLKWYKPTADYSIVGGRLVWASPNWRYGYDYRTGEETTSGSAWNGNFQHLFTATSVGSTIFSNASASWILAHKRTNPGALRPENKELKIQLQWQIDNVNATVDVDTKKLWLWLY